MLRRASLTVLLALVMFTSPATAQTPASGQPVMFVETADEDFNVFITAAMTKKKVPVLMTTVAEKADLTLKASMVEVEKQSTGSKWARCLFAYCAGIQDKSNVSVHVVNREGLIVWSYAVNKGRGGQKNKQSMAEAIAKHFKGDYFKK